MFINIVDSPFSQNLVLDEVWYSGFGENTFKFVWGNYFKERMAEDEEKILQRNKVWKEDNE